MAGLADPDGADRVGDHPAAELHDDPPPGHLGRGRPRVVPDRFLAGADRIARACQSLRCRIFWTTAQVISRPTAPTVAMPAGVCRNRWTASLPLALSRVGLVR